jgi:hypothetical protein
MLFKCSRCNFNVAWTAYSTCCTSKHELNSYPKRVQITRSITIRRDPEPIKACKKSYTVIRSFLAYCRVWAQRLEPIRETVDGNGKVRFGMRLVFFRKLDASTPDNGKAQLERCVKACVLGLHMHKMRPEAKSTCCAYNHVQLSEAIGSFDSVGQYLFDLGRNKLDLGDASN